MEGKKNENKDKTKNGNQQQEDKNEAKSAEHKTKAVIVKHDDKANPNLNEMKSDSSKNPTERADIKKLDDKTTDHSENAKSVNLPGDLAKHSSPTVSNTGNDEREQQGQSSEALMTATTTIKTTNTHNQHANTHISKYTLKHARTVDNHTLTDEELTTDEIPDYIFKNLMLVNYHVREFEIKSPNSVEDNSQSNEQEEEATEEATEEVNPMDAILDIFHRSDDSLRRYLCNKLSACQLSIPFLLPDFDTRSKNITILLSALQNITKSWNDGSSTKQVFATEHPFPVVSFIRIGKPKISKSSLVNKIMSDGDITHDFFFHKDMKGGHVKRKIVDGLVEVSWHLPGRRKDSTIKKEVCFANLRGDARNLQRQLDLLYTISSILFILLPSKFRKEKGEAIPEETLGETKRAKGKVILIFKKKIEEDDQGYFKDLKLSSIIKDEEKNENRFLLKIRQSIEMNIHKVEATPLVGLASRQREDGVHLDVSQQLDLEAEKIYGSWLNLENRNAKKLLKLQTHVPVLADLEREKYWPTCISSTVATNDITKAEDKIYKNIAKEKMAQETSLKELDEQILNCLKYIGTVDETRRNYTLNKIKHRLNKMSLQIMPKLHEEYHQARMKLMEKRKETPQESDTQSPEEKRLEELEESISEYSFGLEHIVRELAQLYQLDKSKYDYAGTAADMLLSGQPLEILDGDSFYIPLEWFKAVFKELEQKTKDAKIFVISVVGIQSSGKSTMLNTMFGLEFPASAGRCTRGAFASLIPLSDSVKLDSKFDYILIIDTEGLSGSANSKLRKHDNQLATFSIAVADVTIVNIMGENQNEMKEFLEIAIHAFLKMNIVEKRKRFCKIIHQNVLATDAREKLSLKQFSLKKDLDRMTKLAASQENCGQKYRTVDDIISFDENKDVFYMPGLWQGNPPMAPVNPEYGKAVQRVKENIINMMYFEKLGISLSQFRERVCNLWESTLKENFIFSFRNIVEVRAYTALDRKYYYESVHSMAIGMSELQTNVEVALQRCSTKGDRSEVWKKKESKIREDAQKFAEKMKKAMNEFFKNSEDKETLEQWREYFTKRIEADKEIQMQKIYSYCLSTFEHLQRFHDLEKMKEDCKAMLLEKARNFITSTGIIENKDKVKVNKDKVKAEFKKEWQQWIECVPKCQETKVNVNDEMVNVLCSTDSSLEVEMRKKFEQTKNKILDFKKSGKYISKYSRLNFFFRRRNLVTGRIEELAEEEAVYFANKTLRSGARCTRNDLMQMYHKVIIAIENGTKEMGIGNGMKKSSICDILLSTFAETYEIFAEMEERFIQQRDIRGDLERNLRPKLEKLFEDVCKEREKEVLAATSFAEELQIPIETALNSTLGRAVTRNMLKESRYKSKSQFHTHVLIQLGEKGKFELYIPYLEDPIKYLRMKLVESIVEYCVKVAKSSILKDAIEAIENDVFLAISAANKLTESKKEEKLRFWIQTFVEKCESLVIKEKTFDLTKIVDLENINSFSKEVRKKVEKMVKKLIERGLDVENIETWNPSPVDFLFAKIISCESVCPFCRALCDHMISDHPAKHSTKTHRPRGIKGYRNKDTNILVTEICTMGVAGENTFRNDDTSEKYHKFKDYQSVNDHYKSWYIEANKSFESSKYFQWFMATFSKELAEHYDAKEPDIPEEWKRINIKKLIVELEEEHDLKK